MRVEYHVELVTASQHQVVVDLPVDTTIAKIEAELEEYKRDQLAFKRTATSKAEVKRAWFTVQP